MNISYNKEQNRHTCMICGKDFPSYHAAYMHIKRLHENHPSMQRNTQANENVPSAPLFPHHESQHYNPEYHEQEYREPVRQENRHNEKEEKDNSTVIALFIIGMVAVGIWIYLRYFKGRFDFWGLFASNEQNDSNGEEPVHWIDNSAPVTKDGAWPVFDVKVGHA